MRNMITQQLLEYKNLYSPFIFCFIPVSQEAKEKEHQSKTSSRSKTTAATSGTPVSGPVSVHRPGHRRDQLWGQWRLRPHQRRCVDKRKSTFERRNRTSVDQQWNDNMPCAYLYFFLYRSIRLVDRKDSRQGRSIPWKLCGKDLNGREKPKKEMRTMN